MKKRGFVTGTAVVMLGLLAIVVGMVTNNLRLEMKRTMASTEDAQVRQLLLAGGLVAGDLPRVWAGTGVQKQTIEVPVAKELEDAKVSLAVVPGADGTSAEVVVAVEYGGKKEKETLKYVKGDAGWGIDAVVVGG